VRKCPTTENNKCKMSYDKKKLKERNQRNRKKERRDQKIRKDPKIKLVGRNKAHYFLLVQR
jgi:hypothetical protein